MTINEDTIAPRLSGLKEQGPINISKVDNYNIDSGYSSEDEDELIKDTPKIKMLVNKMRLKLQNEL